MLTGVIAMVFVWIAWNSKGFREADEVSHLGYAKWAHQDLRYVVDIWGRPLVTLLWWIGAQFGPFFARLTTVLVAVSAAFAARRLVQSVRAVRHLDSADLAVACTLGLPLVSEQAASLLTEIVFASLLGWAFVFAREGRLRLAALSFGFLPLARPEGFWIGPLVACWLLQSKSIATVPPFSGSRWSLVGLLAIPIAAWWWLGVAAYAEPDWFITWWPRNWAASSIYGHGHPLLFAAFLVSVVTPWLWPFFVAGLGIAWRARHRMEIMVIVFVTVLHGVLYALGSMGSAGYPRYLVTLAPLIGGACAIGLAHVIALVTRASNSQSWRHARVMLPWVIVVIPLVMPQRGATAVATDQSWIDRAVPVVRSKLSASPGAWLIADHPWAAFALDRDPNLDAHNFSGAALELAPTGSVAMVESKFATRYGRISRGDVDSCLETCGFVRLAREAVVGDWTPAPDGDAGDPELKDFVGDVWVKVR